MENKIRIVWRVMSLVLMLSAVFYAIALKGVFSFAAGITVFILAMTIRDIVKNKVDERELYHSIAVYLFALLAGISFILIYLGISQITGIKTDDMLEYAVMVVVLSYLPLFRIFGMPRTEL
ncbi:MAG: hypothetical protein KAR84_03105 [Elusimicrobiales bacterium]|nr:hypothetical protein [Elusimicrobiales bacterium]MCK5584074.1 hypothetical protein [Elusimicrobiales bacterium]